MFRRWDAEGSYSKGHQKMFAWKWGDKRLHGKYWRCAGCGDDVVEVVSPIDEVSIRGTYGGTV